MNANFARSCVSVLFIFNHAIFVRVHRNTKLPINTYCSIHAESDLDVMPGSVDVSLPMYEPRNQPKQSSYEGSQRFCRKSRGGTAEWIRESGSKAQVHSLIPSVLHSDSFSVSHWYCLASHLFNRLIVWNPQIYFVRIGLNTHWFAKLQYTPPRSIYTPCYNATGNQWKRGIVSY